MNFSKKILKLAEQGNGIITTAMVVAAGIPRGSLKYLSDNGMLEKVSRGVYTLPNILEDEFVNIQNRYRQGIFSLDTALFLNNITDRTPNKFCMTFPGTYNLTNPKKEGILCHNVKIPFYKIGIKFIKTPAGNKVRAYNKERTLCDILRKRNNIDIQSITGAFKKYVSLKDKNIPLLSKYAKIFNVENKIRSYLEVLL